MPGRDIIVIGGSAGGLEALASIARSLPEDLAAAVLVVVHVAAAGGSALPKILSRSGPLSASLAVDGEPIPFGRIAIAPPDHHLLISNGHLRTTRGPKENNFRPAVDPLFRTAAQTYGPRVIGVVLSGGLDDGTHGLMLIKRSGGLAVVQTPEDAPHPSMPLSAIRAVEIDYILSAAAIGPKLASLISAPSIMPASPPAPNAHTRAPPGLNSASPDPAFTGDNALERMDPAVPPSVFTCPECGGATWELVDGPVTRYRCHVGHSYTATILQAAKSANIEAAIWSGVRALDELGVLHDRISQRAAAAGLTAIAENAARNARAVEHHARTLRHLLTEALPLTPPPPLPPTLEGGARGGDAPAARRESPPGWP